MNEQQLAHFAVVYARMSDEELAHVYVTRGEGLSEEAAAAFGAEVQRREPSRFQAEVQATRADLEGQVAHAENEERKHQQVRSTVRRVLYYFSFLAVVAGASFWLAGRSDIGASFLGLGVGLPVIYEVRRLLSRLVWAILRMH